MCVFETAQDSQVDGILVFSTGSERRGENQFFGPNAAHAERIAQCQLVLRQRAGCSENTYRLIVSGGVDSELSLISTGKPRRLRHRK